MVGSGKHCTCFWRSQHQWLSVNTGTNSPYELPEHSGGTDKCLRVRMWRPPNYFIEMGLKRRKLDVKTHFTIDRDPDNVEYVSHAFQRLYCFENVCKSNYMVEN
jgi:hypothetical protein